MPLLIEWVWMSIYTVRKLPTKIYIQNKEVEKHMKEDTCLVYSE